MKSLSLQLVCGEPLFESLFSPALIFRSTLQRLCLLLEKRQSSGFMYQKMNEINFRCYFEYHKWFLFSVRRNACHIEHCGLQQTNVLDQPRTRQVQRKFAATWLRNLEVFLLQRDLVNTQKFVVICHEKGKHIGS